MVKDKEFYSCSLCGHYDFRSCKCPWHKPFSDWQSKTLEKLRKIIGEEE